MWRGGLGFGLLLCRGFPVRGAISDCRAPFPTPRQSPFRRARGRGRASGRGGRQEQENWRAGEQVSWNQWPVASFAEFIIHHSSFIIHFPPPPPDQKTGRPVTTAAKSGAIKDRYKRYGRGICTCVHCPLSTAYCPLSTVHCPLPTAHCRRPCLPHSLRPPMALISSNFLPFSLTTKISCHFLSFALICSKFPAK